MKSMVDINKEIVIAFADNNMNASKTARALFMHRNTVEYHLDKVRTLTGLNPHNFYHLAQLIAYWKEETRETT